MTFRALTAAALLALSLPAAAVRVTPAHSGSWYDPAFDSQGFSIEVLGKAGNGPERTVAVYWYTYDDDGAPVWAVGVGQTDRDRIDLTMMRAFGGARPPQQVAADDLQDWAEMSLQFGTCNTAVAEFEMLDSGETGRYELQRLTQIGATTCTGGMADEVAADAEPLTLTAQLRSPTGAAGAGGTVMFKLRPGYSEFSVDARQIPSGSYALFVGGEQEGSFDVTARGNGNANATSGGIVFRSPSDDPERLLDFDPRGQSIEVVDSGGVTRLQVEFPN